MINITKNSHLGSILVTLECANESQHFGKVGKEWEPRFAGHFWLFIEPFRCPAFLTEAAFKLIQLYHIKKRQGYLSAPNDLYWFLHQMTRRPDGWVNWHSLLSLWYSKLFLWDIPCHLHAIFSPNQGLWENTCKSKEVNPASKGVENRNEKRQRIEKTICM